MVENPHAVCRAPKSLKASIPVPDSKTGTEVKLTIDDLEVMVPWGTTILDAAKAIGIKIPTLCAHDDLCIAGVCRICVVEVENQRTLQSSCTYPITDTTVVRTNTPKVRRTRRHILELLLSTHYGECYTCKRNYNCELRKLTDEYGIEEFKFGHPESPRFKTDDSSYSVVRNPDKCVHCRRCVRTCIDLQEVGVLEVKNRSNRSEVTTFFDKPLADVICINCGQCINRCPTGALSTTDFTDEVWDAIDDPTKHVVIQTAPSPRAGMGEVFGLEPGTPVTFQMNTALRRAGFDKVFDTNFAADLTIIEEGTELILKLYKALAKKEKVALPQFTSCSPGWIKYIEHFYPEYLPHVSSAKSPQQMFGALIKTYYAQINNIDPKDIVSVSLMPCTAKKFEAKRPEMDASGYRDVDLCLTTRELGRMIKEAGIDLPNLPKSDFDDPFGTATGSGVIFGATGGVMESAIRTVVELVCGIKVENLYEHADIIPVRGFDGVKYAELPIPAVSKEVHPLLKALVPNWDWLKGATLKVGICHGTANAKKVLEDIKAGGKFSECHFIEFMACPGGCIGGGGQPIPTSSEIRAARVRAIYSEDAAYEVRKSYENPAIVKIYSEFLTDGPCGHKSHELLHTSYTARGKYIV
jgi:iron-only hydrogenase group A